MGKTKFFSLSFTLLFVTCCLTSCKEKETIENHSNESTEVTSETSSILIEAENFINMEGGVKVESNDEGVKYIVNSEEDSWLYFDVNILQSGRYKFEVNASTVDENTSVWMEDYIDNKDSRTYNITGSVFLTSANNNSFAVSSKDGSPLKEGLHKMKLHIKGAEAKVDWIKFTLIKKHQNTPELLTQQTDGQEWKLAWSDEFDGQGLPDAKKWTFDIGDWGWGNNELQYYTENREENARQENGNLIIEARKNDIGNEWTSARLTTRGKVSFLYGKIEFRAQVPRNKGNWAAGWTLGDSYVDELSWPYCGEIDILESVGFEVDDETGDGIAHCTVHTPAYYFKINNQISSIKDISKIAAEFHTYSVEWTPTEIKGFVDGEKYYMYDKIANEKEWPFAQPQNIILNLAMGGGWGGAEGMDESMTSQQFIVDYVRVYEKR